MNIPRMSPCLALLFVGCATHDKSCMRARLIDGSNKGELCWIPPEVLIGDLDSIADSTERYVEVKMVPKSGRVKLVWRYDRVGTIPELALGMGNRIVNQSVPMRLEIVNENGRKDVCYNDELDVDEDKTELEILCDLNGDNKRDLEISVLDAAGFDLQKYTLKNLP